MTNMDLALVGLPGWVEVTVVVFLGLLLFGRRLPGVARSLGQAIIEFRHVVKDATDERNNDAGRAD